MKKKIKININRAPVSSEEIAQHKNFDGVLKSVKAFVKPFYQTTLFWGIIAVITLAGLSMFFLTKSNQAKNRMYSQQVLTTTTLPIQEYTIDPHADTVLTTLKGAIIRIPAEAIVSATNKPVVLVIKEAYSLEDIVLAGLTTKSGNELLSSGGMIYIQAKDTINVHLNKPVSVSIPTDQINYNMNVFKGVPSDNGTIDWQQPKAINNTKEEKMLKGEILFKSNCASCHKIGKDAVGSDLAYIGRRRDLDWLVSFIKNNAVFRAEGDCYAISVYEKFNKSEMTAFPMFHREDIKAIADYCNKEGDRMKLPYPDDKLYTCYKKCKTYTKLIDKLNTRKNAIKNKRSNYIQDNGAFVQDIQNISNVLDDFKESRDSALRRSVVYSMDSQAEYYTIETNVFGWYNIDMLMKNQPGMVASRLIVNIDEQYKNQFSVYVVLPSVKVHANGGLLKDQKEQYGFYGQDGTIQLPQNVTAYVYMIGEKDQQVLYASAMFTTSTDNHIRLIPELLSKETFNKRIKALFVNESISVEAKNSKHSAQIKALDTDVKKIDVMIQEAEKRKPECDCKCTNRITIDSIMIEEDRAIRRNNIDF